MDRSKSVFPIQKLPLSKKTKEWREQCVDSLIARESTPIMGNNDRKGEMMTAYGLYDSEYNEEDLKYVTNPFNVEDSFPAKMQNFNIIRPKIDLLIGEESKRPLRMKVIQTNYDAVSKIQEKKKELLLKYIASYVGIDKDENGEEITPPEIEKYIKYNYKTVAEETAYHTLNYLKEKLNLQNEFLKGWKDLLISREEIYYVGAINGEPVVEKVNPLNCDYDKDPDLEFIEDGDWFLRSMEMSPSTIYDRFYDMMTEEELDKLLAYSNSGTSTEINTGSAVNTVSIIPKEKFSNKFFSNNYDSDGNLVTVYHATWRSFKKVGFLTSVDEETGEEIETLVSEEYKPSASEKIKWEWLPEIWEGYKIGEDIYVGIGPVEYQNVSIDNPSSRKLPYCGVIYGGSNAFAKSLVTIMKPLQYMYIVIWFRVELAIARDKGKVLNMDITQIPKGLGISVEQWMHYLSALGVNFINPYDEGWDIPGREGGKPASYNQITNIDLSMANIIAGYIQLMEKIESMIGEISGVSKQRQGSIEQRELVGNVERSVIQSSHITEPLFWVHNQVKKNVFTNLLNIAKHLWSEKGSKKLHYLMNDTTRIFMDIDNDFLYSDYDVFVSDSTQEDLNIQAIRSLLQPAMNSGASLLEAAEILMSDNISVIKSKLAEIEERKSQMQQMQMQMEQQFNQQKLSLEQEKLRIQEEDSLRKAEVDLQVAAMNLQSKNEKDNDNYEKLLLETEKFRNQLELKEKQLEETIRKNKKDEELRSSELQLKKSKNNK